MTSIVVTGAAGFLGYYIAKQLASDTDGVLYLIDNFSRGQDDCYYQELTNSANVVRLDIDLSSPLDVARIPTDVDYVYHLAALNGTQNFYERPFEVIKSCTLPTIYLIEHFGRSSCRPRFIYAGTSEAYAATVSRFDWPVPTNEDVPLSIDDPQNPRWSYGASKLHGEIATIHGCANFDMPYTIVRYHNAYGPRMGDKHVIPDFLMRAKRGEFSLFGGNDTRSFIYATDAARATILLAESDGAVNQTFHVGGARELTMEQLAYLIMDELDLAGPLTIHPGPIGSVPRRCPDVSKAEAVVGRFEHMSLEAGIKETAAYYFGSE